MQLVSRELQDHLDCKALLEALASRVLLAVLELSAPQDRKVMLEHREPLDLREQPELLVKPVPMDSPETKASQDLLDHRETLELLDSQDSKDLRAPVGQRVNRVRLETQVLLDLKASLDKSEQLAFREHKVSRELVEMQVRLESGALMEQPELRDYLAR